MAIRPTRLLGILIYILLQIPTMTLAAIPVNPGISGSWYNPARDGEGFVLKVSGNSLIAYWYTYDNAGNQLWLVGSGTIENDSVNMPVYSTEGGIFGPTFDPATVTRTLWGNVSFSFEDCATATATYDSSTGYGSGSLNLVKLAGVESTRCSATSANDDAFITDSEYEGRTLTSNFDCFGFGVADVFITTQGNAMTIVHDQLSDICVMEGSYNRVGNRVTGSGNFECTESGTGTWNASTIEQIVEGGLLMQIDMSAPARSCDWTFTFLGVID